ncbi:MAG: hypothetical protein IJZ68_06005 [Bacteroidaceae bacterium]|nr:hypothetical protein [Bacteroidaceae bacterium]
MEKLTQKQVIREVRKNCNASIILINAGFVIACWLYTMLLNDSIIGKILMLLATVSYIITMCIVLRAGFKLSAKHLSITKDICVSSLKETVALPVDAATNMSCDNIKHTLRFANSGEYTVLPEEYTAVELGKEYYIVTFGKNKDIAKFYPTDKWVLDEKLQAKMKATD